MFAVHDALDPGLRRDLEHLHVVHDMGAFRTGAYLEGGDAGIGEAHVRAGSAVHPVIDHHPVTGRPYLNVSEANTRFVIGLSAPESGRLLTMLFDLVNRPDFQVRLQVAARNGRDLGQPGDPALRGVGLPAAPTGDASGRGRDRSTYAL